VGLGVPQEAVIKGGGDPGDPCRPSIGWVRWRRGPVDHDRVASPALKHRATLLCDYLGVEVPTYESLEVLDATKVVKHIVGFVSSRTVVAAE